MHAADLGTFFSFPILLSLLYSFSFHLEGCIFLYFQEAFCIQNRLQGLGATTPTGSNPAMSVCSTVQTKASSHIWKGKQPSQDSTAISTGSSPDWLLSLRQFSTSCPLYGCTNTDPPSCKVPGKPEHRSPTWRATSINSFLQGSVLYPHIGDVLTLWSTTEEKQPPSQADYFLQRARGGITAPTNLPGQRRPPCACSSGVKLAATPQRWRKMAVSMENC